MILHAIHTDKTFGESGIKGWIIIKSPDTDVLILCIHYFPSSLKFSGLSLSTLKTVLLPIPNKDDVVSHPVMACAAGKMLHKTGLRMLQIECTMLKNRQ
jgi:hypothetical protein